ncbi:MAG: phosphohistidine phosphatase SixA [Deltaproteobacteria bacterium]|nr:MAG: phosphohistidine phosphatase SixA [Deltaproteobacteria bacterium]
MRAYLIRHGHAVSADTAGADDRRWLSEQGRAQLVGVAERLRDLRVSFDAVVCSPLVRAVQTAELLAGAVGFTGAVEVTAALAPGAPADRAEDELAARGVAVAAVGHEPGISALAARLCGRLLRPFRPGQVACVDGGALAWWIDPDAGIVRPA